MLPVPPLLGRGLLPASPSAPPLFLHLSLSPTFAHEVLRAYLGSMPRCVQMLGVGCHCHFSSFLPYKSLVVVAFGFLLMCKWRMALTLPCVERPLDLPGVSLTFPTMAFQSGIGPQFDTGSYWLHWNCSCNWNEGSALISLCFRFMFLTHALSRLIEFSVIQRVFALAG